MQKFAKPTLIDYGGANERREKYSKKTQLDRYAKTDLSLNKMAASPNTVNE